MVLFVVAGLEHGQEGFLRDFHIAHAAHAAIILSLESVFAAVGGWLLLDEFLSLRGMMGCGLMLTGMLLSQFNFSGEQIQRFCMRIYKKIAISGK